MLTVSTTKMTSRQFLQLGEDPPGVRLELVNGEIAVSPSPTPDHSYTVIQLIMLLGNYIQENKLGELHQDVDTVVSDYEVRRPDILFFSNERTNLIGEKAMHGPPDLAIEVISESSKIVDRKDKFQQYRTAGVLHYWIADPVEKTLEAWQLRDDNYVLIGKGRNEERVQLQPFEQLVIPLFRLWRRK
jgi:Uma2 family endonuclease